MKTITCLVLAVILLTFIAENGDGKITILHEGRVSGKPRRKSRRQTVRKRPSTTANEDNGSTIQDRRRPVVCNHTINVCLLLFQRLLSLWSRYLSSVNDPTRRKKLICVFFSFHRNTTDGTSPHTGWLSNFETLFTSETKRTRYCYWLCFLYFRFTLGATAKDILNSAKH